MRYYLACLLLGVLLAQAFEAWYDRQPAPPVAVCPNYDELRVAVNPWRIDSPTRTIIPDCEAPTDG